MRQRITTWIGIIVLYSGRYITVRRIVVCEEIITVRIEVVVDK